MFSILGMINSYIGYFNMNATLKNRIYTVVGGVGNFYLLYVAYRFFANGFIVRGLLFILAFLALLYFTYLNILYFFTEDRVSKLDISPKVEKMLGVKIPDTRAAENAGVAPGFMQTNGIFKDEEFLPSTLRTNHKQRENLQKVVAQLEQVGYLQLDFGGKDKELFKKALSFVLKWEGGYVNDPNDKGGATNKGITQGTYNGWLVSRGLQRKDVKFISQSEVEEIYFKNYWLKAGCDKMSRKFAVLAFDTAVNMGVGRVQEFLRAAQWKDPEKFIKARESKYREFANYGNQKIFLKGWLNRLNALRTFVNSLS